MSLENDGSGVATQSKASVPVLIPPGSSPPSVLESNEYLRNLTTTHLMIPTTVTDLCERKQHHNYEGIIEDLYRILAKLSAENKSLKLSLSEQQEIIENEVRGVCGHDCLKVCNVPILCLSVVQFKGDIFHAF